MTWANLIISLKVINLSPSQLRSDRQNVGGSIFTSGKLGSIL